jgi:hypothetical protein
MVDRVAQRKQSGGSCKSCAGDFVAAFFSDECGDQYILFEGSNPSPKEITSEYALLVGTEPTDHHSCRHPFFEANAVLTTRTIRQAWIATHAGQGLRVLPGTAGQKVPLSKRFCRLTDV